MTNEDTTRPPTLADVLSPKGRRLAYAFLGLFTPLIVLVIALLKDGFQWSDVAIVVPVAVSSAGFKLARDNVSV